MLHCLDNSGNLTGNCSDMTLRQRKRALRMMKSQQHHQQLQPQQQSYFFAATGFNDAFSSLQFHSSIIAGDSFLGDMVPQSMNPDPVLGNGWPELSKFHMPDMEFGSSGFDVNSAISTHSSCPPSAAAAAAAASNSNGRDSVISSEKLSSANGRQSFKKRKADKAKNPKVIAENENKDKRIKVSAEEAGESKITEQTSTKNNTTTSTKNNKETSADNSKENSKASEVPKPDYIHVRARRGQATDSHSLAERVRREKISKRMKYLQDLVPGCDKITGKAGMLDEIINYVQSLQKQVEFLSMKLAAVNPALDFNINDLFSEEMCPPFAPSFPAIGMSTDMTNTAYLQFNSAQQMASCSGLDMGINPSDVGLRASISDPVSMPDIFIDSSCFTQQTLSSTPWEDDLQNLYNVGFDQARSTSSFPSQPFTGAIEASNLKMEM